MRPVQLATKNVLLGLLSTEAFEQLAPFMHMREHPDAMTLVDTQEDFKYAYFPEEGLISSVVDTQRGTPIEVGTVGREGFAGIPMVLGSRASALRLFSQLEGFGWQIEVADFETILKNNYEIRQTCNRFIMTSLFQATQTIACNRVHSLKQRCARWLLTATDRDQRRSVRLTNAYLAMMVGYEDGVSETMKNFEVAGLVRNDRLSVAIDDRKGLELISCECYADVKTNFDFVMQTQNRS